MSASPPEGTRAARLPQEDDAEQPPPSSSAHRRPTRELGADVYDRATAPGVYPGLAGEQALREMREAASATAPATILALRTPASERPRVPISERPRAPISERPRAPISERPRPPAGEAAPVSERPRAPISERSRPPASERPRLVRLTEPLAAAYAPPGHVLPFEPSARSPSSPSTSFGPISAMTLPAAPAFPDRAVPASPQGSRLRAPAAGVLLLLGVAALVALVLRGGAAPEPAIEPAVAAATVPTPAVSATATESPAEPASMSAPGPTAVVTPRGAGWKPPSKAASQAEPPPTPSAPRTAPTASSRARHRLFDTEN